MTFSGSVVAKTNLTCSGGSSTTFRSALKPCVRDHVGLVDDVDLVARRSRCKERPVAQLASIVDAPVACGIDLDHVDAAGPLRERSLAALTLAARFGRRTLFAVQAAREDARRGGLAAAARAREEVGVRDPVVRQGLHQGLGDVFLPDQVGEPLGPVAAVEGGRHGHDTSRHARHEGTPRTPARARLPLLPSGPGGVQRDDAARGVERQVYAPVECGSRRCARR